MSTLELNTYIQSRQCSLLTIPKIFCPVFTEQAAHVPHSPVSHDGCGGFSHFSARRHPYYRKLNHTGTRAGGLSITAGYFNQLRQHSLVFRPLITYTYETHIICLRGCVDHRTYTQYVHVASYAIRFKHMQCSHSTS